YCSREAFKVNRAHLALLQRFPLSIDSCEGVGEQGAHLLVMVVADSLRVQSFRNQLAELVALLLRVCERDGRVFADSDVGALAGERLEVVEQPGLGTGGTDAQIKPVTRCD